jgi:hypothetical protein
VIHVHATENIPSHCASVDVKVNVVALGF